MLGTVKNNADPMQLGRLQVYVPTLDSSGWELERLPWARYISPFGGTTVDFKCGREKQPFPGISTYGMWAVPKNGAQVLVGCMEGEPGSRFWIGALWQPDLNRTLPFTVDELKSDLDDSGLYPQRTVPFLLSNMEEAGIGPSSPLFTTRGYERSVAFPLNKANNKPTSNGYYTKPMETSKTDSQTYSITTPGRHFFVMSDVDQHCRIRLRTTEGHQVIFDDSNERIYISTAKGRNWIEIDEDGRIHIYAKDEINIRSEDDINISSDKNVNIKAKEKVNIKSESSEVNLQAQTNLNLRAVSGTWQAQAAQAASLKSDNAGVNVQGRTALNFSSTDDRINVTARAALNLRTLQGEVLLTSAGPFHLKRPYQKTNPCPGDSNPSAAAVASGAQQVPSLEPVMVEPEHEPWDRPLSKLPRNPTWKP